MGQPMRLSSLAHGTCLHKRKSRHVSLRAVYLLRTHAISANGWEHLHTPSSTSRQSKSSIALHLVLCLTSVIQFAPTGSRHSSTEFHDPSLPFTHAYKKKELTRLFELKPTTLSKAEANKSRALFIVADLLWARESSTIRCAIRCDFYKAFWL